MENNSDRARVPTDYISIQKGRGWVYACENYLYNRVKTEGQVKYLKCCHPGCDGAAKLVGEQLYIGVSTLITFKCLDIKV